MEPKKVMQCTCENCGNEAEMTIKCEEVVVAESAPQETAPTPPQTQQVKRTNVCTACGNEADMIVDL
jgi:thymidine kinase